MTSPLQIVKGLTLPKKIMMALSPIVCIFADLRPLIYGLLTLIFLDLITGIRKSLKEKGVSGNPLKRTFLRAIKSYSLRQTWKKMYGYLFGVIAIVILEDMVLGTTPVTLINKTFTLSELAVVIPSIIEVWSIYENIEAVSGDNYLKRLKEFLPEPIRKLITKEDAKDN